MIAGGTFEAAAAAADERHGDAVAGFPAGHLPAGGDHRAGQFVAGHMRQADVGIVSHPAMPVGAAEARRLDLDNDALRRGLWVRHGFDRRHLAEFLEDNGFHRRPISIDLQWAAFDIPTDSLNRQGRVVRKKAFWQRVAPVMYYLAIISQSSCRYLLFQPR